MRPGVLNPLFADVSALKGVGPKLAALISKVAGPRVVDVLLHAPVSIIDRSARPKVADAEFGAIVTLDVRVDKHHPGPRRGRPYRVICSDETGFLTLVFFHPRPDYLKSALPEGARRLISGRIEDYGGARQMTHPDHIADPDVEGQMPLIEPVYALTAGLTNAVAARAARAAVARAPDLPEWQDDAFCRKSNWPSWRDAVRRLHAPESAADLSPASAHRRRLAFDELLANQLALALMRAAPDRAAGRSFAGDGRIAAKAAAALPFKLTQAQRGALSEIYVDMAAPKRMARLLQGDVGSGKTIVAFFAMLRAVEAGAQAGLMAPTELLARQHFETLEPLARAAGVSIGIVTGRDKGAPRAEKLSMISEGATQIVLGTHALFQDEIAFRDLALVVVDEQHRFGVHQRLALSAKGKRPDLLVMTATPIPRTLALTAYGDLDLSAIREKPPGRRPVSTVAIPLDRLNEVVEAAGRAASAGDQIYWVCPLVEESEELKVTAAAERFEALRAIFGDKAGLVHGRLTPAERDAVMEQFHERRISILVATTVIEVGVNAPNATIMVIEHAERFGLAQLHQLRGRVGRGEKPSSCILLYKGPLGETASARLKILRESDDGFRIAEEDLRLRGPGDALGAAQSGFPDFRLADPVAHADLLAAAHDDAKLITTRSSVLEGPRGEALRTLLYLFSRDDAVRLIRSG